VHQVGFYCTDQFEGVDSQVPASETGEFEKKTTHKTKYRKARNNMYRYSRVGVGETKTRLTSSPKCICSRRTANSQWMSLLLLLLLLLLLFSLALQPSADYSLLVHEVS
jgi:uncharacterized integral membrane protein